MGIRHSKLKIRRSTSRSSRKRQSPEGQSNSSPDSVNSTKTFRSGGCVEKCPCQKECLRITEENKPLHSQHQEDFNSLSKLRVPLTKQSTTSTNNQPSPATQSSHYHHLLAKNEVDEEKGFQQEENKEWTMTLLLDGVNDQSQREKILRMMTSIEDVVTGELSSSPQVCKKVKVRLSVTPESRLMDRAGHGHINHSALSPSDNPGCGTVTKSHGLQNNGRTSFDTEKQQSRNQSENFDRRLHYKQIPGLERSFVDSNKINNEQKKAKRENTHDVQTDLPTADHCALQKKGVNRSRSRDRPYPSKSCCRHHGHCCSERDKKFPSTFDQRFQEAMLLRLTELQRNSARQAKLARRAEGNIESCEDDSSDQSLTKNFDSEYSGDEDNCVVGRTADIHQGSRMFEPLSCRDVEEIVKKQEPCEGKLVDGNEKASVEIGDSHYRKKDHCTESTSPWENINKNVVKPWQKSKTVVQTRKRKSLTKKRFINGSIKMNHGYLRANAITGDAGHYPNTPRAIDRSSKSTVEMQGDKHKHIHHHYYYHYEPDPV